MYEFSKFWVIVTLPRGAEPRGPATGPPYLDLSPPPSDRPRRPSPPPHVPPAPAQLRLCGNNLLVVGRNGPMGFTVLKLDTQGGLTSKGQVSIQPKNPPGTEPSAFYLTGLAADAERLYLLSVLAGGVLLPGSGSREWPKDGESGNFILPQEPVAQWQLEVVLVETMTFPAAEQFYPPMGSPGDKGSPKWIGALAMVENPPNDPAGGLKSALMPGLGSGEGSKLIGDPFISTFDLNYSSVDLKRYTVDPGSQGSSWVGSPIVVTARASRRSLWVAPISMPTMSSQIHMVS